MRFDSRGSRCVVVCVMLLGVGALTGCTHPTVVVTRVNSAAGAPTVTEKVDGIPFYAKYGVCQQETVWLEPQYTWSLTVQADDQAPMTKTVRLSGYAYQQPAVQASLGSLQALNGKHDVSAANPAYCPDTIHGVWDAVTTPLLAVVPVTDDTEGLTHALRGTLVRVANTATVVTEVDYSRMYYINTRTPFIGTGNIDAKLNTDGTLTEGNAQVNDQTWSAVLSSLSGAGSLAQDLAGIAAPGVGPPPTATYGSSHGASQVAQAAEPACQFVEGWPDVKKTVTYTFAVTPVLYQHHHTLQTRLGADGACEAAKGAGVTEGNFVVSPVALPTEPAKTPAPDAGKKPDAPAPAAGTPVQTPAKP